jgi:hypothetical protein
MSRYIKLASSGGRSGVDVAYDATTRTLTIGGWYDSFVGIEPQTVSLDEFLRQLGVRKKHCVQVFERKKG